VTAARYVTIWCDGKVHPGEDLERDCGNYVDGDTARHIRSEPKAGWLHGLPGGRDLCPEHAGQRDELWRWGTPTHRFPGRDEEQQHG
jgi:hypothetical protein